MPPRAATALVVILVATGCGDATTDPPPSGGLGQSQFATLTRELAAVAPRGQLRPEQAAATARRQATIARGYAEKAAAPACKTKLEELASAYTAFGRASAAFAAETSSDQTYAQAAAKVSSALTAAESACV